MLRQITALKPRCGAVLLVMLAGSPVSAADTGLVETPLAAPASSRSATLFSTTTPAETGVVTENKYADAGTNAADPRMRVGRHHEFSVGAVGTGVTIGDYDQDGRPDLFVVSKTESCRLFRNLGDWKFADVTERAGVGNSGTSAAVWKQGATFVDVDNDGWLDLYVCRFAAPNLLYRNRGDGTFAEEAAARGLALNDASVMGAFCDYDRDGWLDVYVQTNLLDAASHPDGQRDHLFHNNRDGTFTDVSDRAGIAGETQGHSTVWWDYNNDGWPDLYVANDFAGPDTLYHNNRDGTFTNVIDHVLPHMPLSSMGADLGDVNNDGLIDLMASDMAATTHEKDQRTTAKARSLNGDPPENSTAAPQYQRNALFLNTGTDRCLEAAFLAGLAATDWTWSVRFEDLDNDGRLDLHVTNGMHREVHNSDLIQRISTANSPAERERIQRESPVLMERNLAFRNEGDMVFTNVSAGWGLDEFGVSFGAALGDLDADGDLDLAYTNYRKGVTLLRNNSDSGHRVIVALRGTRSNRFGIGATVRIETDSGVQVRPLVLARGVVSSSEPVVHFGVGDNRRLHRLEVAWPSGHVQTFTGLPVDHRFTVTEPDTEISPPAGTKPPPRGQFTEVSQAVQVAFVARETTIEEIGQNALLPMRQNRRGPAAAVGDLNGDGIDDLVFGGTPRDPARIFFAAGVTSFATAQAIAPAQTAAVNDGPLLVFDADGDGDNDVLLTRAGIAAPPGSQAYQSRLLFNDGHGALLPGAAEVLPALPISVGAVAAVDFNHDGRLDVFVGGRVVPSLYPLAPKSALLINRGGRFADATDNFAPGLREIGMVTAALWSDADDDGWPDLLLTLEWGEVRYLHNRAGQGFDDWTEKSGFLRAGTGWWNSIAAADFNRDGRLDYVVGNVGLNTQYHASPQHPALLFFGDFANGGAPQLVEAHYEGDRLVPWRNLRQLSAKIPSISRRFPQNDLYARATLEDLVGAPRLAAARRLAATELRSGVLLSDGRDAYRFEPLPRMAQIAPMQGVVTGDFDADGNADIATVQNNHSPAPVVGRFDGGLGQVLSGDGRGHFRVWAPAASGLIVTGDARGLALLDLEQDGWADLVATRNNGPAQVWRNHGVSGRQPLRITLRGSAGNPTAVGASVRLELTDGGAETYEVSAGSGHYSQSAAACFFGYPADNPPQQIRVRWPSGAVTRHDVPSHTPTLSLVAESPLHVP